MCANVHGETGLCDCPPIDADLLDGWTRDYIHTVIHDFERFAAAMLESHNHELAAAHAELDAALADLDRADERLGRIEADYLRQIDAGATDAAAFAARMLERETARRQTLERRIGELQRDIDAQSTAPSTDHLLDGYNTHRAAFARLDDALFTERANEELRAQFQAFRLELWMDHHLVVTPVRKRTDGPSGDQAHANQPPPDGATDVTSAVAEGLVEMGTRSQL